MTTTTRRIGTLEPAKDASGKTYFRGKVRLADGSRARIEIPESKCYSETASRDFIAWAQEHEDTTGEIQRAKNEGRAKREASIASSAGETCDAWFDRATAYAKEIGHTDYEKKRDRWRKWIAPLIGSKPIALVTRDDIEDVRDDLDRAIAEWKRLGKSAGKKGRAIAGKTAMNVWSTLTSSFKAATSSKNRSLRVLDGKPNPCIGVEPPGDRDSRQSRRKTFLYPTEATQLLSNEVIPIDRREIYAVALFTYLRPGELRVLTVGDIDLVTNVVHVTKAWDYQAESIKPPKTRNGVRRVPIDPSLAPLLERLIEGREPHDLIVPTLARLGEDHVAEMWRKDLKVAGIERTELHTSTRTHVMSNFRSCRDSGITWLAIAGVDVAKMMRRAGHDQIQTTMGYVKLAEDLSGDLGAPFPPLPASLIGDRATRTTLRATQSDATSPHVDSRHEGEDVVTPEHVIAHASTSSPIFNSLLRH